MFRRPQGDHEVVLAGRAATPTSVEALRVRSSNEMLVDVLLLELRPRLLREVRGVIIPAWTKPWHVLSNS